MYLRAETILAINDILIPAESQSDKYGNCKGFKHLESFYKYFIKIEKKENGDNKDSYSLKNLIKINAEDKIKELLETIISDSYINSVDANKEAVHKYINDILLPENLHIKQSGARYLITEIK